MDKKKVDTLSSYVDDLESVAINKPGLFYFFSLAGIKSFSALILNLLKTFDNDL